MCYTLLMKIMDIVLYTTDTGKKPFAEWQTKLAPNTEAVILKRLARMRSGNFGDCKQIKGVRGIYELRIDYGPGYRIYYGKSGTTVVVLLVGGCKGSQSRDIAKATRYWLDFKEKKHG